MYFCSAPPHLIKKQLFFICLLSFTLSLSSVECDFMASTSITSAHAQVEEFAPSTSSGRSYDVFINHRGPDVKHTLATTLYKMLTNSMGLRVFLDSEELELGDDLPIELEAAMKSASLHIAIFSKNYAQSRWCLEELSFMLRTGTKIVPIFYHVKPDDVRYAKGVYAGAFERHEEKRRYTPEKLQEWKDALYIVSNNIGHIVNSKEDEDMLLKNIAYCIVKVVKKIPLVVARHPVGLDETVKDFEMTTLQSGHQNVQIVGIWGKGGSGKTTLAKELFNRKYPSMEKSSLILDVRDAASKNLLHNKQKKLLENLGFGSVAVDSIEDGNAILAIRLRSVRAFIVLDDVDHVDQLNALLPAKDSLGSESLIGSGSLIVVTTREIKVLTSWGISSVYKMKPLSPIHSKQLFCWHAFLQPSPSDEFEELAEKFLKVCSGLPLSLKVLGGQLYGNSSKDYWEIQLEKISRIVPKDIKQSLKISYDALDDEEKEAFLDIACFFIGKERNLAIEVWNGSGWTGLHTWEMLVNKCLVEVDEMNSIIMHDHLRDLGREIANQQSPYRLCFPQQIIKVDNEEQNIGIPGIMATLAQALNKCLWFKVYNEEQQGIGIRGIMDTPFRTTWDFAVRTTLDFENSLPPEEFGDCSSHPELMVNTSKGIWPLAPSRLGLKIIVARGRKLNQVISAVSRDLVWLRWIDFGLTNLQSIPLKNLRVLELYEDWERGNHHLRELWVAECDAPLQLRELVISDCIEFRGFPRSVGYLKHLKKIVLGSPIGQLMKNMESLPEEFCLLQSLEHLVFIECGELSSLPNRIGNLRNLRHLALTGCSKLERLPDSFKELMLLQHLDLRRCFNLTFKSDIMENMSKLEYLSFTECEQLEELPLHITKQASLRELYLNGMDRLREMPMKIGQLSKLRKLETGRNSWTSLPASLGGLSSLTDLSIFGCRKLECLPDSVGHLNLLERLTISVSGVKSLPDSVCQLINLKTLWIERCPVSKLNLGVGSFGLSLGNLKSLYLRKTELSKISISEDCCPGLEGVTLDENDHLTEIEVLPSTVKDRSSIVGLVNLQTLRIINCHKLYALPSFAQLPSLREFELSRCYQVKKIHGLRHCTELEVLKAYTWLEAPGIESLECMERLKTLHLGAMRKSVVEGCIQNMQKWPGEIIVCTRAVRNAASLLDSFNSPSLSVVDSCANLKIDESYCAELVQKQPTNGNAIIVCFVINCVIPRISLCVAEGKWGDVLSWTEVEEGKWVWIGVLTQRSQYHTSNSYKMDRIVWKKESLGDGSEAEVEKGLLVMGEEQKLLEAFRRLWGLIAI